MLQAVITLGDGQNTAVREVDIHGGRTFKSGDVGGNLPNLHAQGTSLVDGPPVPAFRTQIYGEHGHIMSEQPPGARPGANRGGRGANGATWAQVRENTPLDGL